MVVGYAMREGRRYELAITSMIRTFLISLKRYTRCNAREMRYQISSWTSPNIGPQSRGTTNRGFSVRQRWSCHGGTLEAIWSLHESTLGGSIASNVKRQSTTQHYNTTKTKTSRRSIETAYSGCAYARRHCQKLYKNPKTRVSKENHKHLLLPNIKLVYKDTSEYKRKYTNEKKKNPKNDFFVKQKCWWKERRFMTLEKGRDAKNDNLTDEKIVELALALVCKDITSSSMSLRIHWAHLRTPFL